MPYWQVEVLWTSTENMPIWAWFQCLVGGGDTPNIETIPRWAWFWYSGGRETHQTSKTSDIQEVGGLWTHAEHQKNAQMDMVSMFGRCRGGGCMLSIKNMPIWAFVNVWWVARWWTHTEHRKNSCPGMVSMVRMVDRHQTLKPCPDGCSFDVWEVVEADGGGWRTDGPPLLCFKWGWRNRVAGRNGPPSVSRFERGKGMGWLEGRETPLSCSKNREGSRGGWKQIIPSVLHFEQARGIRGGWKVENPLHLAWKIREGIGGGWKQTTPSTSCFERGRRIGGGWKQTAPLSHILSEEGDHRWLEANGPLHLTFRAKERGVGCWKETAASIWVRVGQKDIGPSISQFKWRRGWWQVGRSVSWFKQARGMQVGQRTWKPPLSRFSVMERDGGGLEGDSPHSVSRFERGRAARRPCSL